MAKKKLPEEPPSEAGSASPEAEPVAPEPTPTAPEAEPPKPRKKARKAKAAAATASLGPYQVSLYSLDGDPKGPIDLPAVFRTAVRPDLIRRAVTAARANRRQPYGPSPTAGMRHSVRWAGKGRGASRVPRIRGSMTGAQAPGTVGGRRAHPPRPRTIWAKKINDRERSDARLSAIAATHDATLVAARGHRFREGVSVHVVVEDAIEGLKRTSEGIAALRSVVVFEDVERADRGTGIRAGRGKMRGRRYRVPRSVLIVLADAAQARRVFGNLPGVDVAEPRSLNAELLAPGGDPGRLVVFSEGALGRLQGWS